MSKHSAIAVSCSNIAFIKYWGNRDHHLRIPANGSISMNLAGLTTHTQVTFDPYRSRDELILDGVINTGVAAQRVSAFLDLVRRRRGIHHHALVTTENNFPMGTGIASSASAFAALALAASTAAGLNLDEHDLSRLARRGSGSACRSIPGGFVEWRAGETDQESYATTIAPPEYWDLTDHITIISQDHKDISSAAGHPLADTSPIQARRVSLAPTHLDLCRRAILERDFETFVDVVELDSNLMHAVMMTSKPPLFYWQPTTLSIMQAVQAWRRDGIPVCYTTDAGPNVHVICPSAFASQVYSLLGAIPGVVRVLSAQPGAGTRLLER
jgi:diphosphomevalonate decarboxylase